MGNACEGRVALVTGASRGIGRATAVRVAAEGADVAVVSRPQPGMPQFGSAAETVAQIESLGGRAHGIEADLADPNADPAAIVAETEAALGPVDILVNNVAGGGYRPFFEWTDEQIGTVLQLNFWVPWNFVRAALPGMQERGRGWILNVSSASAITPQGPPFPKGRTIAVRHHLRRHQLPEKIATMTAHRTGKIVAGEVKLSSATLNRANDPE